MKKEWLDLKFLNLINNLDVFFYNNNFLKFEVCIGFDGRKKTFYNFFFSTLPKKNFFLQKLE